jgi:hypothetical protein
MSPKARRVTTTVLLVLATFVWTVGIVAVWAKRQALDTDNWVHTSDRLLENEQIRTTLSDALLQRLYASRPVETKLEEELPAPFNKLAGPISGALRQVASENAPKVLGSAAVLTAWERTNRAAHRTFLKLIRGERAPNGEVTLDLKDILTEVANGTGLPAGVVDRLPPRAQQLTILRSDQLAAAQDALDTARKVFLILVILAILLYAAAIGVAPDRRRACVGLGASLIISGIVVLAARKLGDQAAVNALAQSADVRPALKAALVIGTSMLVDVAQGTILLGFIILLGAWLAGPGKRATVVRRVSAPALREHPAVVRIVLGLLLLLLVIWGPVPWTQQLIPVLVLIAGAYIWLEWVRLRTLDEFGDVEAGEFGRTLRGLRSGGGDQEARAG